MYLVAMTEQRTSLTEDDVTIDKLHYTVCKVKKGKVVPLLN
jgi:hypothetical protein